MQKKKKINEEKESKLLCEFKSSMGRRSGYWYYETA